MNLETVKKVKRSKAFTVLDGIIVAVLVAAVGVCAAVLYSAPVSTFTVTAPGYEREFSLGTDRVIKLEHLTVRVKSGKVWVTDSDCRDHTCEHTGKISRAGQSIVCLPNNVVISINGESDLQWEVGR
ncbi:MAG: NusG domain II-containing protein [Clostridiales bacterium]|nr:NusG domain II-containing protein [Clostridiales bacterium]